MPGEISHSFYVTNLYCDSAFILLFKELVTCLWSSTAYCVEGQISQRTDRAAFKQLFTLILYCKQRISDSLNERLPTKLLDESFKENNIIIHGRDNMFSPRIIRKRAFLTGQVLIKEYGLKTLLFAFQYIGNRRRIKCLPHP